MKILQDGDEIRCVIQFNPYEEVRQAFDKQLRKIEVQALEDELAAHGYVKERTCKMEYNEDWSGDELYPTKAYRCFVCRHITQEGKPFYCPWCGAKVVNE